MTALRKPQEIFTPAEYLERERAAEEKSEYLNGIVAAREGNTFVRDVIKGNIAARIGNQLVGRHGYVFTSDMKVRVESANLFRYPDVSAVCGPIQFHDDVKDAYENPSLIVEVRSSSTANYDRAQKFALYRFLDSFAEYLLVAQDRIHAELFRKQPDGQWTTESYTAPDEVVTLESIGCTLRLTDIYDKVLLD